jgi:hypothetical protein
MDGQTDEPTVSGRSTTLCGPQHTLPLIPLEIAVKWATADGTRRALSTPMRSRLVAVTVTVTYLSFACAGCLSNEYVIPKPELQRLAGLPPSQRGAEVHVVQSLGSRDEDAIDNPDAVPRQQYIDEFAVYDQPGAALRAAELPMMVANQGGFPSPRGQHGRPSPKAHSSGFNPNLNFGGGGGGGGGNGGDALLILAVVLVAVAVMAAAGLAVTEGLRFDGLVQLHPQQPLLLKYPDGSQQTVPLANLTALDAAVSEKALVLDDQGYGFRFDHRRPLDRAGFAFKVDFGSLSSLCACYSAMGFGSNIQFGYFPHHRVGLLGTLSVGAGKNSVGEIFQRHSANLELQYFPLSWWRLHLGGFGHLGEQVARDEFGTRTGAAWGGGAILELALTTRLALTGRMDYTVAHTAPDGGWASTSVFSGGLAIY